VTVGNDFILFHQASIRFNQQGYLGKNRIWISGGEASANLTSWLVALKRLRFENLKQLNQALFEGLDYWNNHRHPYTWKKRPQEQIPVLGGFGVHLRTYTLAT
jgi:hypothetical protein